jgi:hypothetical protein
MYGQEAPTDIDRWDNTLYLGIKVANGKNKFKYTGEFQVRLKEDLRALDNWYLEGIFTYLATKRVELVPDLRLTVKPRRAELRPAFGIYFKHTFAQKMQLVNQIKHQVDVPFNGDGVENLTRYVIFLNQLVNDKILLNYLAGMAYQWKPGYTGIPFVRGGMGAAYVIDVKHTLNFTYYVGAALEGDQASFLGGLILQFIFNINKDYKYLPARYIDF